MPKIEKSLNLQGLLLSFMKINLNNWVIRTKSDAEQLNKLIDNFKKRAF